MGGSRTKEQVKDKSTTQQIIVQDVQKGLPARQQQAKGGGVLFLVR
jgi:hypothetical protein